MKLELLFTNPEEGFRAAIAMAIAADEAGKNNSGNRTESEARQVLHYASCYKQDAYRFTFYM